MGKNMSLQRKDNQFLLLHFLLLILKPLLWLCHQEEFIFPGLFSSCCPYLPQLLSSGFPSPHTQSLQPSPPLIMHSSSVLPQFQSVTGAEQHKWPRGQGGPFLMRQWYFLISAYKQYFSQKAAVAHKRDSVYQLSLSPNSEEKLSYP